MPIKNEHYLDVDLKLENYISLPRVTRNDDVFFIVRILDDGRPVFLNNVQTALLASLRPDKKTILTVGNKLENEITFKIESASLSEPGRVNAAVQLFYTDGRTSTLPFHYEVVPDNSIDYAPSESETSLIQMVLGDAPFVIEAAQSATIGAEDAAAQTLEALDNFDTEKSVAIQELDDVKEENRVNWKQEVATVALRDSTYPNPQIGDTVRITGEARIDRFNGTEWITTDRYNPAVVDELTGKLAETVTNNRNFEYGTKIISHAGANVVAPESTNPAFAWAGKAGYKYCETDVQITSDGEYIVMHDDTVDRMTNGSGKVLEMTSAQIQSLSIDSGINVSMYPNLKVPTLDDFLKICIQYSMIPIIEYKPTYQPKQTDIQKLIDVLDAYNLLDSAQVISFNGSALTMLRSLNKRITLQFLADPTVATMNFAKNLGNAGVGSVYTILTKEYVDTCHKNGVFVGAWTVNDYDIASKFKSWGVDFITTNKVLYSENLGVY